MAKSFDVDDLTDLADVLKNLLTTPNESDSNGETPNIVDGLYAIARSIDHLAVAVNDASLRQASNLRPAPGH